MRCDAWLARRSGRKRGRPAAVVAVGASLFLGNVGFLTLTGASPAWADAAVVTSAPTSPSNNLHPSWGFSAGGSNLECELLNPNGTTFSAWAPCTSPTTYNLTGHADGTYTFYAADSKSAPPPGTEISAPSTYRLDTTPPAAPKFTSAPATPGNATSPSWSFTAEAGSTTKCQVTNSSGTVVYAYAACTSPKTVDLSAQPDDTYTLSVTATDAAGNTSTAATSSYQLLTTAPAAPTFTAVPSSPGNNKKPSWSFTTPSGTTTTCQVTNSSGTVISAYASCTSPATVDLSGQPDDTYTLSVVATDAATNKSSPASSSYQLLTATPAAPTFSSSPPSPGSSPTPTWFFSLPAGTTATCQVTNSAGTVLAAYAPCTSPVTVDLSGEPDDTYTLSVVATDAAGNASPAAPSSYALDTTPPPPPTFTSSPTSPGRSTSPTWGFTVPAGAGAECQVTDSGGTVISALSDCTSPYTLDLSGHPDGTYTLSVVANNAADVPSTPVTSSYTLDTTPPAAPTITAAPRSPGNSTSPRWSFTSEPGSTTTCQLTNSAGTVVSAYAACTSPYTADLSGQPDDTYTLSVVATDAAGNASTAATSTYTLMTAPPGPPTITSGPPAGSASTLEWGFTAPPGTTPSCQLTGPGNVVLSDWASCSSPVSFPANGGYGTYTLNVRATDVAGNVSPVTSAHFQLDPPFVPPAPAPTAPVSPPPPTVAPPPAPQPTPPVVPPPAPVVTAPTPVAPRPAPLVTPPAPPAPQPQAAAPAPAPFQPPLTVRAIPPAAVPTLPPPELQPGPAPVVTIRKPPPAVRPAPAVVPAPAPGIAAQLRRAGLAVTEGGAASILLYLILVGFLAVQNRIDRNDPKLALAPVFGDPDLPFVTPPHRGAHA